jgi:hypothetical protein
MRNDEKAPINGNSVVDAAELGEWLGVDARDVTELLAGVLRRRREDGLFPLKLSIQAAVAHWERQTSGGRLM